MCILHIYAKGENTFFEVAPSEKMEAELFVEDMVSHVLLNLFGEGTVDDVTIRFSSTRPVGAHYCSLSIRAQCSCQDFVLRPHSQALMKQVVEQQMSSLLKELFVSVQVEDVVLSPSQRECEYNPAPLCRT